MIEYENQVLLGDCLDWLRKLPDECLSSCVTDPPYGIGTREPTLEEILAYLTEGKSLDTNGDFMGRDWQLPSVETWREVFRVMKPGGYVLAFAGTRTFDLMSIGLRAAGFENRDTIDSHFGPPILQWLQSQGMPKSQNVSSFIDKRAGAEREVIGPDEYRRKRANKGTTSEILPSYDKPREAQSQAVLTRPSTDDAKAWEGWGTNLKPSFEPILMFRKPLQEKTIADQVLKTGTGAININGCRVKHSSPEDFEKHKAGVDAIKARGGSMGDSWKNSSDLSGANEVTSAGRWPSNTILVHSDGCHQVGTQRMAVGKEGAGKLWSHIRDGKEEYQAKKSQLGDADGKEEVPVWECVTGCPVAILDQQSGDRPATLTGRADPNTSYENPATARPEAFFGHLKGGVGPVYADRGGASRYFAQFEIEAPFIYHAKTTKKDRTAGGRVVNKHPTVKPVSLMRYLVRLVTVKGGLVLDPYAGSGTTLVAAIEEGVNFIGIERDAESHETAQQRIDLALGDRAERSDALLTAAELPQE